MKKGYQHSISLADIGAEMIRASKYEAMYYALLEKYEELEQMFADNMERENKHHQQMMGGFLELAMNMKDSKK